MADDPENLILVYLRRLDSKMDHQTEEIAEIKLRLNDLTRSTAAIRRDQGADAEISAHLQAQLDRLQDEIARIKRRLDISE